MCIVSFVKTSEEFILTFNRDERRGRSSEKPAWRNLESNPIFCPIDKVAGGTWIGYNRKIIACLQNGALEKHSRDLPYEISRGQILKDLLINNDIDSLLRYVKGHKIEPFTLSIYNLALKNLSIYRHDGIQITIETSDLLKPMLICSSTLYNNEAQNAINSEFRLVNFESIFNFHDQMRIGSNKNKFTDLVDTVSITQFRYRNGTLNARYYDVFNTSDLTFEA
ncbi:MAG: NRDE family protein [bacterium]|nr:NRDE family protein [bacterium]